MHRVVDSGGRLGRAACGRRNKIVRRRLVGYTRGFGEKALFYAVDLQNADGDCCCANFDRRRRRSHLLDYSLEDGELRVVCAGGVECGAQRRAIDEHRRGLRRLRHDVGNLRWPRRRVQTASDE